MGEQLQKTKFLWKNNFVLIFSLVPIILVMIIVEVVDIGRASIIPSTFGDQKTAMFDLWSIQHFLAGVLIGSLLITPKYRSTKNWQKMIPLTLFIGFGWEALELLIESGGISIFKEFWNNREHWSNRLITDPAMVFVGGIIGYIVHDSWKVALVPTILWLVIKAILV